MREQVGSGMTPEQIHQAQQLVSAVIVGTYFHRDGDTQLPCVRNSPNFISLID